jgi:hypothetical protein
MANAAFLALSGVAAFSRSLRARLGRDALLLAAAGSVWMISIVQTLLDHGDNPRFLVPMQMMVCFAVVVAIARALPLVRRDVPSGAPHVHI